MQDDLASLSSSTRADSVQQHERRPAAQVVLSVKPPVVHTMQKVRHGEMYLTVTPAHQKCNKKERRKESQHRVYDRLAKDNRSKKGITLTCERRANLASAGIRSTAAQSISARGERLGPFAEYLLRCGIKAECWT